MSTMTIKSARSKYLWVVSVALTLFIAACTTSPFNALADFIPASSARKTDFTTIARFADYAQAAYKSEQEIKARFPDTVLVSTPPGTKTSYFLDMSAKTRTQTISVRGTHSFDDILHDIEFQIVKDDSLNVSFHKGFQADAFLIYEDVKPHLRKDYQTRLTGHSLGAAVSAILMIYMQRDGYKIAPTVNFGQPKFTNTAGAELYKDLPVLRVVDGNDVVPMLPPALVRHPKHGYYTHIGDEVILLAGSDFIRLDKHDAERISVNEYWRERKFASKEDHHVDHYVERVNSKVKVARQLDYTEWQRSNK